MLSCVITPYIRILDFDWLIACVFFVYFLIQDYCCSFLPLQGDFHENLTFFSLCAVVFAKTYFTFLPSRATNRQIHSEYFNHCLTKQIEILPLYLLKGTRSKRPIVFNNCQVTNNKRIFLKTTNKRYYLISQCSK